MKIRKVTQGNQALVLGGGGATGNAWSIGVIAGLFDAGLDVRRADLIIGTSAGATVAAQVCSTMQPPELFYSGVDLADAVAASTAGGFAYSIGGSQYIDGGYRSDVNADLATGYQRILVIAPLGIQTRKPLEWRLHLNAQINELRARGSLVETILPDSESQNAIGIGMDLMDLSGRRSSAQAGYNQGKAFAEQSTEFWC